MSRMKWYRPSAGFIGAFGAALVALGGVARADELAAFYRATWAGLPAGELRLGFGQASSSYRDEIEIESKGLPQWFTKFRGSAVAEGHLGDDGSAVPSRYEALYDLRKRHSSRISMRFNETKRGRVAERTPEDTSRKPPLADIYRRNVADPLSALAAIRQELRVHRPGAGAQFRVPVYDGARRFDVAVTVLSVGGEEDVVRLKLSLVPIAGFKGGHSDDGDPDDAPRPVDVVLTHDERLLPVSMRVSIAYLPLVVRFHHSCATFATCGSVP